MARNTDGEFEMILGNKQLLSLFFLVVVLFAVFFSLGYMVGRSVSPGSTLAAQPAAPAAAPDAPRPTPTTPAGEAPVGAAPVAETQPARSEPAPAAEAPEPAPVEKTVVRVEPEPVSPVPAKAETAPALVVRDIHLQIAAVRVKEDAEAVVENLRQKGYTVQLNSQTRDGWHRIIVGPFPTERAAQDMKAKLEKDGYKSILKKP